jgi:hypothetical protein
LSGCVCRDPSALLCPGAYDAVKIALGHCSVKSMVFILDVFLFGT